MSVIDWLLLIIVVSLPFAGGLLLGLSLAGWVLTPHGYRTRFGTMLSHFCGSLGTFLIALEVLFLNRMINGAGHPIEPHWVLVSLYALLALSLVVMLISAALLWPGLILRYRQGRLQ